MLVVSCALLVLTHSARRAQAQRPFAHAPPRQPPSLPSSPPPDPPLPSRDLLDPPPSLAAPSSLPGAVTAASSLSGAVLCDSSEPGVTAVGDSSEPGAAVACSADPPRAALLPPHVANSTAGLNIMRQDHLRVRAIWLNEEDWREVDLEKSSSARNFFGHGLGSVVSPIKDEEVYVSQLYRRAVLLNDEFQLRVHKAVHRRFGHRFHVCRAPVKTKERMLEKLLCYAAHDPDDPETTEQLPLAAYILDPVRATVVCDGPAEMVEVAGWLAKEGDEEQLPVVRVKNKFAVQDASEYDGYRDLMVCVLYTGSHDLSIIGEIQIHDRRLHALKLTMHKLYKVKRAAKATAIM